MLHTVITPDRSQVMFGYENYTEVLETSGTLNFDTAMLRAIGRTVPLDEIMIFCRRDDADAPSVVLSFGNAAGSESRAEAYRSRYHRYDPLNRLLDEQVSTGLVAVRVRAEDIAHSDYRRMCYSEPKFAEKMSIAQRTSGGWVVLSLYRNRNSGTFSDEEQFHIVQMAEILLPIIALHCRQSQIRQRNKPLSITDLEMRLKSAFPSLSGRERNVCARTLAGVTAEGIALDLGIKQSSVFTYRRRAYERLNICTAHQMSAMLLS
ncbi:LuxR C-terminal-related transcriptional regulator [Rhizobium sp. Root1204]|uniref:helix-turn-helix transcriptional regulator n=1 Tax=Rhizobium sp. Root1204 TaxID=1736428 RepID=UPI000712BA0E|nr:LuxR C-terminal-related transcriptional regulator [Rhizobium sp. Root1204]KQV36990.1 hypothetical protein ASC96_26565 [Rhizobium sp. Root1204]